MGEKLHFPILFAGMFGLVVYSLIKFRRRPGQSGDGQAIEGNLSLEILWTAVPAIVVLFIGIYSPDFNLRLSLIIEISLNEFFL